MTFDPCFLPSAHSFGRSAAGRCARRSRSLRLVHAVNLHPARDPRVMAEPEAVPSCRRSASPAWHGNPAGLAEPLPAPAVVVELAETAALHDGEAAGEGRAGGARSARARRLAGHLLYPRTRTFLYGLCGTLRVCQCVGWPWGTACGCRPITMYVRP